MLFFDFILMFIIDFIFNIAFNFSFSFYIYLYILSFTLLPVSCLPVEISVYSSPKLLIIDYMFFIFRLDIDVHYQFPSFSPLFFTFFVNFTFNFAFGFSFSFNFSFSFSYIYIYMSFTLLPVSYVPVKISVYLSPKLLIVD